MPAIPLSDGNGVLVDGASSLLIAHLSYPGDPRARSDFLLSQDVAQVLLEEGQPSVVVVPRDVLLILHSNPGFAEIKRQAQAAAAGGFVAGYLLSTLLRLREFHPEHASMRKAIWVVHKLRSEDEEDGRKLPASRSYIREQWRRYRSVAHFYMALQGMDETSGASSDLSSSKDLLAILARAEACLREAGKQEPPILDLEDCWRAPDDLTLPTLTLSWTEPTPEEVMEALKSYRAPRTD